MPPDTEHDERTASSGKQLRELKDVARVFLLSHRDEIARLFADKQIIAKLRNEHDVGIQTIARRRHLRND